MDSSKIKKQFMLSVRLKALGRSSFSSSSKISFKYISRFSSNVVSPLKKNSIDSQHYKFFSTTTSSNVSEKLKNIPSLKEFMETSKITK